MLGRVKKCKICGKFMVTQDPFCETCAIDLHDDFQKVRQFLIDFPEANAMLIAEKTGVDENIVVQMINSGWLIEKHAQEDDVKKCMKCGKPLTALYRHSKYCKECATSSMTMLRDAGLISDNNDTRKDSVDDAKKKTGLFAWKEEKE